jgi:hypothetical protein
MKTYIAVYFCPVCADFHQVEVLGCSLDDALNKLSALLEDMCDAAGIGNAEIPFAMGEVDREGAA